MVLAVIKTKTLTLNPELRKPSTKKMRGLGTKPSLNHTPDKLPDTGKLPFKIRTPESCIINNYSSYCKY